MKLKNYKERVQAIPEDVRRDAKRSMDILDRIQELLHEKFDGKQKLLAERMGKTEAEVSKWINGNHNFTMRTIAKLEAAFGADILAVCTNKHEGTFEQVALQYNSVHKSMQVSTSGLEEVSSDYERVAFSSTILSGTHETTVS
jgi:transcriptional regulator with XRE-family HTH domain